MDGWMDGRMMDEWTIGMNGWMNGCIVHSADTSQISFSFQSRLNINLRN